MKPARIVIGLAAAAALIASAAPAAAQEGTLKKVKESGTITIGHRDASIPFSYYDDKQQADRLRDGLLHEGRRRGEARPEDAGPQGEATSWSPRPTAFR